MVGAQQISKSYQDVDQEVTVFKALSFRIEPGQTVALMGQSGAGKSTLLHLLGGFDSVSSGRITVDGQCITEMNDAELCSFRRFHLGMVFQQFNLIPSLTARDNVTFVRRLNGMPALDEFTHELVEVLGLSDRLSHYPKQLSIGEQQRVAIARAVAARPKFIMADEPTGNLDEETASHVMELLMKAVELDGVTLLLVTHSPKTARYLQTIWKLEKGRLFC